MDTQNPKIKTELAHSKETKGTHQYLATDDTAAVKNIYIQKTAIKGDRPDKITLTVDW
jgi:hypothetical protein